MLVLMSAPSISLRTAQPLVQSARQQRNRTGRKLRTLSQHVQRFVTACIVQVPIQWLCCAPTCAGGKRSTPTKRRQIKQWIKSLEIPYRFTGTKAAMWRPEFQWLATKTGLRSCTQWPWIAVPSEQDLAHVMQGFPSVLDPQSVTTAHVTAAIRNCHKWWTQGLPSSSEARGNNGCRGELTNEVKTVEVKEDSGTTEERSYFNRRSDSISILRSDQFKLIMGRSGSF